MTIEVLDLDVPDGTTILLHVARRPETTPDGGKTYSWTVLATHERGDTHAISYVSRNHVGRVLPKEVVAQAVSALLAKLV